MDAGGKPICDVTWLGLVDYDTAWHLQETLAADIAARRRPPVLLLLEHPHVYTLGRRTGPGHILWDISEQQARAVQVREVDRGGDVTYHGPGQLVGYPLLPLAPTGWQSDRLPQADFVGYVRKLEETLILALAKLGLVTGQRPGLTGVWVMADVWGRCSRCDPRVKPQPAKIASIGVKVDSRGVSRHGFALNISPDRAYWDGIIPCGLDGVQMADLADFFDPPPPVEEVARLAADCFARVFEIDIQWKPAEDFKMDLLWNEIIARQTQACLDMLSRAIRNCPETLWEERLWNDPAVPGLSAYWYLVYHTLFWADADLTGSLDGFAPPAPFTLSELDPAGLLPDRVYTPAELLAYLDYCKNKAREKITGLTGEQARMLGRGDVSYAERLINTIRHIQEHTAQLNLFLGQKRDGYEPGWVTVPKEQK